LPVSTTQPPYIKDFDRLKRITGVFMKPDFNPIIQEQASDNLAHVNDILAVIQTFFASSDLPATDYEKSIYVGIYSVLDVARHALLHELERLD
jgi:hypothetical protein